MVWHYIAIVVVSIAISYALAPRPPKPTDAEPEDTKIPKIPKGEPIPVVFGTVWLKKPGVLFWGDKSVRAIRSEGGGKK